MEVIAFDTAIEKLEEVLGSVCDDHAPVVITTPDARSVVMISLEDFESYEATAYLLRSPANAARLAESLRHANAGESFERDLIE